MHVSTDEVYGSLDEGGRFTETTPYAPNSPYSASKAAADHFARAYHHTYGLPIIITNCSNNFGPYQFPEKLIPLMILNAVEGKQLPVYGDGGNVRDWLFVEDHCRALLAALARGTPGEVYNIGGECPRTNLEIVRRICELVDELCPDVAAPPFVVADHVRTPTGRGTIAAMRSTPPRPAANFMAARLKLRRRPARDRRLVPGEFAWVERVTSGVYRRQRLGLGREAKRDRPAA